jgi:hypothetical protein
MSELFRVNNHHIEAAGQPPNIDENDGNYHGYFENEYGEQALFVYDRESKIGTLYMGDAGWERAFRVEGGLVKDLVLNMQESL